MKTRIFDVRRYDTWGNARDGWEVNDSYRSGTIEIKESDTDYQIMRKLECRRCSLIWSDDTQDEIVATRNGKPLGNISLAPTDSNDATRTDSPLTDN